LTRADAERVALSWPGRAEALGVLEAPPRGSLQPLPQASLGSPSAHRIIQGDNLEVMKLLRPTLAGQVRVVLIDPPYNTGQGFLYRDRLGSGAWLSMMLPRLALARELLREDGVLFVFIDDGEVHRLRMLLDELFGVDGFVATVIWQKAFAPKNSARHFSADHDYVLVYAKDPDRWRPELLPRSPRSDARYRNPDGDPRGPWASDNLVARNPYSLGTYAITCPSGRLIPGPPSGSYWRVSKARFEELDRDGRIHWGRGGAGMPRIKRFLSEVKQGSVPRTLWTCDEVGHSQEAKKELLARVRFASSASVFETPKPTRLIERILRIATRPDRGDIVLDFFAGTGTTGEVVMKLNATDGGDRRFLLVQLAEPTGSADHPTIAHIARARLRAAAHALAGSPGDLGFEALVWEEEPR
jgi:adenine-specific DNA-methyltransferase